MVAYSFKKQFAEAIVSGEKRQTVRAPRKRHARVGEPVQLYVAMRTKHCRKLISPDPICSTTQIVKIWIDRDHEEIIAGLALDGRDQAPYLIERFAVADGFGGGEISARRAMGEFWVREHLKLGDRTLEFLGVVIRWRPANG